MIAKTLMGPLLLGAALAAQATDFQLTPVQLPGGVSIFGTISTDGTLGPLTAANLSAWSITVRRATRHVYTPSNPGGAQVDVVVSADGRRMSVKASPDGVRDGGLLSFGSFGPGPEYGVKVADFTGYWGQNGGVAFYLDGPAFDWEWFNAPNGSTRLVAKAAAGSHQFKLQPVVFSNGSTTIAGQLTTDGSVGALGPANVLDWRITATSFDDTVYTKTANGANSSVLAGSAGISSDGQTLSVARPGGLLAIGVPAGGGRRGAAAVLADFSATAPADGQAGYYDAYGSQYVRLHFTGTAYPVATLQP